MDFSKVQMPRIESSLRHGILKMPDATYAASGIVINGRRMKSFVFTTDLAIIRNCDADAVFAVYPSMPQHGVVKKSGIGKHAKWMSSKICGLRSATLQPYTYRYSRIWWHGTDGRIPFLHQQYLGLLIRPKPASS